MKKLLKVSSFTAILTLLRMVMGFAIAKVVAVYTGPTGMAILGQLNSIITLLVGVTSSPVKSGIVRYTSEYNSEGVEACSQWWKAGLYWSAILLAFTLPLVMFFSEAISLFVFERPDYYWVLIVFSISLPLSVAGTFINSVINGQQQYKKFIALGMVSVVISSSIMIVLISLYHIEGALIASSLQTGLIGLVMIISNFRAKWFRVKYFWGSMELKQKIALRGYMLMALTSAIMVPTSIILVRKLLTINVGWESTGHWQAVWKISEVYLSIITISLSTYYLPKLSSLKDARSIKSEINKTVKVIFPIVILLAIGVYLFRDLAISLLFTSEFAPARNLFAIQLMGDVVKMLSWLYAYPMISRGATKWFISTEILFAFSFVFLSWLFIGYYGVQGANIAYLVNYICYFIFVYFNLNRFSR